MGMHWRPVEFVAESSDADETAPAHDRPNNAMIGCPFAAAGSYTSRPVERLLLDGIRLWGPGMDEAEAHGDTTLLAKAWELFARELGPERARCALDALSGLLRGVAAWRPEPLRVFRAGCPHVCRDECLIAALVAGAQHGDWDVVGLAASRLGGPSGSMEVTEAAIGLGVVLSLSERTLLPVPGPVLRSLVDEPPSRSVH